MRLLFLGLLLFAISYASKKKRSTPKNKEDCLTPFNAVYFVVDGSASVKPFEFINLRDCLISTWNLIPNSTFVEFYQYSSGKAYYKKVEPGWDRVEFKGAVNSVLDEQLGSGTDTFTHLGEVVKHWEELKSNQELSNSTAKALTLLITDGVSNDVQNRAKVALRAIKSKMRIFPIGVGIAITKNKFEDLVSQPGDVAYVNSYKRLTRKLIKRVLNRLCFKSAKASKDEEDGDDFLPTSAVVTENPDEVERKFREEYIRKLFS